MVKILFHMQTLQLNGGTKVTLEVAEKLAESGHDVSILLDETPKSCIIHSNLPVFHLQNSGEIQRYSFSENLPNVTAEVKPRSLVYQMKSVARNFEIIHRFRWAFIDLVVSKMLSYTRLKSWLDCKEIDVIISTSVYNRLYIDRAMSAVRPVILHLHNDIYDITSRKNINLSVRKMQRNLVNYAAIICVSEEQRRRLCSFSAGMKRVSTTIYNPIDSEKISYLSNQYRVGADIDLLYVGSLVKRKRVDRILHALAKNKTRSLTIIGSGAEQLYLESLARELNIENNVHFVGEKENPYPFIRAAKALVLSSQYEALPTVILEAFSLSTPVIASDCHTGPRELMKLGHGWLLPNDDLMFAKGFATCLRELDQSEVIESQFKVNDALQWRNLLGDWTRIISEVVNRA